MNQFNDIQSGDAVTVTLKDLTTLDCTVRRLVGQEGLLVTTPQGENDPTLQATHYIDDYVQMVRPIPTP